MFYRAVCLVLFLGGHVIAQSPSFELGSSAPGGGVTITEAAGRLTASWKASKETSCQMLLVFAPGKPLIESLSLNGAVIANGLQPVYRVAVGPRKREVVNARYTFFDHVFKKDDDVPWSESVLTPKVVRVTNFGIRSTIEIDRLHAGPFHGALRIHLYAGSPLIHLEAAMTVDQPESAYSYEAVLETKFANISWCNLQGQMQSETRGGAMQPLRVRYRSIMGHGDSGTVAMFPPPHAYLYPKDEADNFGFVQAGARGIGICQPVKGLRLAPLFDAPAGRCQRMSVFLLLSGGDASATLEAVKRYTHGDTLKEIDGCTSLITHEHAALTVHDRTLQPRGPAFVAACKQLNVKIIQLAEFHGDGLGSKENDTGIGRLNDYRDMYDTCRRYSDEDLLVLPGEEPNCAFPGHWIILFPKPVFFTRKRAPGQPYKEMLAPYGTVYHLSTAEEAHQMLVENDGLAWTAHPRIKGSRDCPDKYRHEPWYQSPQWLGGTWKAMPGDLSQPRLGVRCLDLLDDMNLWGQRKFIVGEFDCFKIDEESEFYGNVNASYLRLSRKPTIDDWSPVLECLRKGDFFVTTGEVLLHSCDVTAGEFVADVEWTLPLAHAEVVACDGQRVERRTVPIDDATEFGRRTFRWPLPLANAKWARLEVWDIADDGAFTQPIDLPGGG